jgi:hypothetical protein
MACFAVGVPENVLHFVEGREQFATGFKNHRGKYVFLAVNPKIRKGFIGK